MKTTHVMKTNVISFTQFHKLQMGIDEDQNRKKKPFTVNTDGVRSKYGVQTLSCYWF